MVITFYGPKVIVEHLLQMIDSLSHLLSTYPNLSIATATYEKDHNAMNLCSLLDGITLLFKKEE